MSFFEKQSIARSNISDYLFIFFFAIIGTIIALNILTLLLSFSYHLKENPEMSLYRFLLIFDWQYLMYLSFFITAYLLIFFIIKYLKISSNSNAITNSLNCILINKDTKNPLELNVLNILEEMAIASNMPVPALYLIDSDSINAFSAGMNPQNSIIAITKGAIKYLSYDEIQGVIAHEFSHIFNNDMKINLQITAILAGIMSFSIIGFHIFHKSKSKFRTTLGLGLIIIGFFGYLFGLLAQFAINKQREFLADSMAVQYTRNNHGIANALKKIKSMESGSLIFDPRYNQINHMLFASSSNLFNTHPPINDRIRAIDPDWDGKFIEVKNDLI